MGGYSLWWYQRVLGCLVITVEALLLLLRRDPPTLSLKCFDALAKGLHTSHTFHRFSVYAFFLKRKAIRQLAGFCSTCQCMGILCSICIDRSI